MTAAASRRCSHRTARCRQGLNCTIYHDHYQRTGDGWKFAERVNEVRYLDPHHDEPADAPRCGRHVISQRSFEGQSATYVGSEQRWATSSAPKSRASYHVGRGGHLATIRKATEDGDYLPGNAGPHYLRRNRPAARRASVTTAVIPGGPHM